MWNAKLDEAEAGIKIDRRNINNLRYADDTTLMAESEEELKSLLMKAKEDTEKVGLKLNIQKTKIMAPGPITSWQRDGETMETVRDFIFMGCKITADGDCTHGIKRCLLLGRNWKWKSLSCVQLFVTHGLYSPWDSPGQNTGVGSLSLLQGIFPTQGPNPGLSHCRQILHQLSYEGSPSNVKRVISGRN